MSGQNSEIKEFFPVTIFSSWTVKLLFVSSPTYPESHILKLYEYFTDIYIRYGLYLGEIQCKNGISLEKMKNFQNEATDFYVVLFYLKLLVKVHCVGIGF